MVEKEGKAGLEVKKGTQAYSRILPPWEEEKEYPLELLHPLVGLLGTPAAQPDRS